MENTNLMHEKILSALKGFNKPASALDIANKHQMSPSHVTQALKDLARDQAVAIETESAGPAYHTYKPTS